MNWTSAWASTSATRVKSFPGSKSGRTCLGNIDAAGRLDTEADADLKEAPAWYEGIHPDLGVRFARGVDDLKAVNPGDRKPSMGWGTIGKLSTCKFSRCRFRAVFFAVLSCPPHRLACLIGLRARHGVNNSGVFTLRREENYLKFAVTGNTVRR